MTEQKRILIAVMITSFIGPFMGSSVNIAVPAMAEDFNMMPDELTWAVTAFFIGSAATLLPFGRLADIKGRRRIYLQGLACICATTLVCAVVQNFLAFIFVRFLQGLSMSMIFGTSMALLVSCCGAENRGKTIGLSAACVYSGVSLGPFIGGFITDYLGWRMIFWLTGIALLINFFLIFKVKTDWYGAKDKKFDYIGSIIYLVIIVLFLYGLSDWTRHEFVHYMPFIAFILFLLFIYEQKKVASPLVDLSIFRNTVFTMSNIAALIHYSATFALGFVLSLYLQLVRGMDAFTAGGFLLIQPFIMTIVSPKAGALSDKFSSRLIASLGMGMMMIGLFAFSFLDKDTSFYLIGINLAFIGLGFGLFASPNNNAIMGAVEAKFYGVASSILAVMRLTGQAISMSLVLKPTITVRGSIYQGTANDATEKIYNQLADLQKDLPFGYSIEPDGAMSDSQTAMEHLLKPIPVMVIAVITILMFQLRSVQLMIMTVLTAPLGLIGVSFGMLLFDKPIGFVAVLGILALFGMIIRNSIILIDQIKKHMLDGEKPWNAIIDSAVLRFRPIMLTAAAAILGMMPLVPSTLWGSMAIAISCGLVVATILTLLILPTMYAAWFKITPDSENKLKQK